MGFLRLLQLRNPPVFFSHRVTFSATTDLSLQGQHYRCGSFPPRTGAAIPVGLQEAPLETTCPCPRQQAASGVTKSGKGCVISHSITQLYNLSVLYLYLSVTFFRLPTASK